MKRGAVMEVIIAQFLERLKLIKSTFIGEIHDSIY